MKFSVEILRVTKNFEGIKAETVWNELELKKRFQRK